MVIEKGSRGSVEGAGRLFLSECEWLRKWEEGRMKGSVLVWWTTVEDLDMLGLVEVMIAISVVELVRGSIRFGRRPERLGLHLYLHLHPHLHLHLHLHLHVYLHLSQRQHPSYILSQQIYPDRVITLKYVGLRESGWVAEEVEES